MSWKTSAKISVAKKVVQHIKSGMVIGLGSGSTAAEGIKALGNLLKSGIINDVKGVPTSYQAINEAIKAGIPLTTLDEYPKLDFGFDGADQIDQNLNAIKGGGGALLREKIVASSCKKYVFIVDKSKLNDILGTHQFVYLEVHPIAVRPVINRLREMRVNANVRLGTKKLGPIVTDNGNHLIDADFGPISDPGKLDKQLHMISGILETGLFINLADFAYIGDGKTIKKITS